MRIEYSAHYAAFVPCGMQGGFEVSEETFYALSWCTGRDFGRIPCGSIPHDKMKAAILAFDAAIRGGTVDAVPSKMTPEMRADLDAAIEQRRAEQALLLATARALQAHFKDSGHRTYLRDEYIELDEALKPFGPSGEGGDGDEASRQRRG